MGSVSREHATEYHRKWRAENGEAYKAYQRDYYQANKEKLKERMRANALLRQYGLTVQDYDDLLEAQGGGCAVCGVEKGHAGNRLAVDHDHSTGEVRGLLCDRCNLILGKADDNPELLLGLAAYLQINKT